jgi:NAD(P)-dependent dehydrogenase (short-subunit alcohol dehydrogenase family)
MIKKVLITGASGLLGRALTKRFLEAGFVVLAQYRSRTPIVHENCRWLRADFSTLDGIWDFLRLCQPELEDCGYLINNYGPITSRPFRDLTAGDFYFDYHHNVVTAFEITRFLIRRAPLRSVVNIGFEFLGEQRAYRKILTYAAAKNALLLTTKSFEREHPDIAFHIVPLLTLEGAEVASQTGKTVSPGFAAGEILSIIEENCAT